jgi:hypothetical protein
MRRGWSGVYPAAGRAEAEKDLLKEQADLLRSRLEVIEKRLQDLQPQSDEASS